jgi:hypothetical protein
LQSQQTSTRLHNISGHAITQAVCHWLPTTAACVLTQVRSCRICDGQSGIGADLLQVLNFPLPIFIHQLFHIH